MDSPALNNPTQRVVIDGFAFPLGVYPVEPCRPRPGYTVDFEPADGGDADSDWEEWPDRYMYDVVVPAPRLPALVRALLARLPARVYPILDILGQDAYREVDPYIAYDPIPIDRFLDAVHRHKAWLFEDGLVGFGAMSDDPFLYVYVDEHKIVTVRAPGEIRDEIEKTLDAFDLSPVEELAGADAAEHEHRGLLTTDGGGPSEEQILEELLVSWRLQLNIDHERNTDDDGRDLGVTAWRCLVRLAGEEGPVYGDVWLRAGCYDEAESLAVSAVAEASGVEPFDGDHPPLVIVADRVTPEAFAASLQEIGAEDPGPPDAPGVVAVR
ncbi:MAG: hypothetical protein D6693_11010 [Planctomycetota bacterium]|nr:MAG: hypothetical protein D6693_11010 [Planctomycetota bacterium]